MHQACGNNVNTALPKRRFRDWGRNSLQLQGFTDHIEDILGFFGYKHFGKINSGNIFYLIGRLNHEWVMMEHHYLLYDLFFLGITFTSAPKKHKKLRVFCVFFQDGSNKPCCKSSPQIRPMWNYFGNIPAFGHTCTSPEVTQKVWSKWQETP